MPFNYLLTNLLVDVPSAVGAIFLDVEGEAVEWVTRHGDPYDLKVEGAYHCIFRRALDEISPDSGIGRINAYVMEGEQLTALTQTLPDGYYVVLVLDGSGSRSQALYHLRRTAQVLARELS
jgi:hypothetical protein